MTNPQDTPAHTHMVYVNHGGKSNTKPLKANPDWNPRVGRKTPDTQKKGGQRLRPRQMDKSEMPKPPDYLSLYSLALTYLNVRIWKMKTTKKIKKKKKKRRGYGMTY